MAGENLKSLPLQSATVVVPDHQIKEFDRRLAALNKKGATFGLPPIRVLHSQEALFEQRVEFVSPNSDSTVLTLHRLSSAARISLGARLVRAHDISIEYPIIKLGAWAVSAQIEALTPEQNLVFNIRHEPDDLAAAEAQRNAPMVCEHCGKNRRRKLGYLLRDAGGAFKRVGSNCLRDFTGVDPAVVLFLARFQTLVREPVDPDGGGANVVGTIQFIAGVIFLIEELGFVSSAKAKKSNVTPTYSRALNLQSEFNKCPAMRDRYAAAYPRIEATAMKIVEWYAARDPKTTFDFNVKAILAHDYIPLSSKHLPFVAAAMYFDAGLLLDR